VAGLGDKYLASKGATTYIYTSTGGNDIVDDSGPATLMIKDIKLDYLSLAHNLRKPCLSLDAQHAGRSGRSRGTRFHEPLRTKMVCVAQLASQAE
jgi:hypothetical protein